MSVAEIRLYLGYTALAVYLALPLLLPAAFVSAALALTDQGRGFLELSAPPSLAYALLLLALVTFTFALGLAIRADRPPEDSAEQRRDYVLHWYASFSGPLIVATIAMYLLPCLIEFFLASGTQIPSRFAELLLGETRLLALLFLTALASVFIPAQRVRELAVVPQTPTAAPSSRPPIAAFVRQWVEQRRSEILAKAPYPVFLVAAPGGGIRASYWTAGVLGALQDHDKAFARHVLAISSVSGSSVGAGIFAALVKSGCRSPTDKAAACRRLGAVALSADFLAPPIYALMTRDVVGHPLGLALSDRAAALERAFEQQWRDTTQTDILAASLDEFWKAGADEPPPLFINTTDAIRSARLVIGTASMANLETLDSARQTMLEEAKVPLITALLLSARFPCISPQGLIVRQAQATVEEPGLPWLTTLKLRVRYPCIDPLDVVTRTSPPAAAAPLRLTDGGFADNSGAATLLDVLGALEIDKTVPDVQVSHWERPPLKRKRRYALRRALIQCSRKVLYNLSDLLNEQGQSDAAVDCLSARGAARRARIR